MPILNWREMGRNKKSKKDKKVAAKKTTAKKSKHTFLPLKPILDWIEDGYREEKKKKLKKTAPTKGMLAEAREAYAKAKQRVAKRNATQYKSVSDVFKPSKSKSTAKPAAKKATIPVAKANVTSRDRPNILGSIYRMAGKVPVKSGVPPAAKKKATKKAAAKPAKVNTTMRDRPNILGSIYRMAGKVPIKSGVPPAAKPAAKKVAKPAANKSVVKPNRLAPSQMPKATKVAKKPAVAKPVAKKAAPTTGRLSTSQMPAASKPAAKKAVAKQAAAKPIKRPYDTNIFQKIGKYVVDAIGSAGKNNAPKQKAAAKPAVKPAAKKTASVNPDNDPKKLAEMKKKYGLAPPPQQGVKKAAKPAAKPVTKKAAPKVVAKKAVAKKHVAKAAAKAVAKESTKPNVKPVDLASILVDTKNDVEKGTKLHDAYERRTAEAFKQDQENAVAKLTTDPNKLKAEFLKQTIDEITLNQKPKQEPKKMTVAQHIEQARAKRRHAAFFKPKGK